MRIVQAKQILTFAILAVLCLGGLSSCGKRGDPIRPSEIEQTR